MLPVLRQQGGCLACRVIRLIITSHNPRWSQTQTSSHPLQIFWRDPYSTRWLLSYPVDHTTHDSLFLRYHSDERRHVGVPRRRAAPRAARSGPGRPTHRVDESTAGRFSSSLVTRIDARLITSVPSRMFATAMSASARPAVRPAPLSARRGCVPLGWIGSPPAPLAPCFLYGRSLLLPAVVWITPRRENTTGVAGRRRR